MRAQVVVRVEHVPPGFWLVEMDGAELVQHVRKAEAVADAVALAMSCRPSRLVVYDRLGSVQWTRPFEAS